MEQLRLTVPTDKISCIHVNDSKNEVGSHKDRHATIGTGKIPLKSLAEITTFDEFYDVPKIIESPQNLEEGELTFKEEMNLLLTTVQQTDAP